MHLDCMLCAFGTSLELKSFYASQMLFCVFVYFANSYSNIYVVVRNEALLIYRDKCCLNVHVSHYFV